MLRLAERALDPDSESHLAQVRMRMLQIYPIRTMRSTLGRVQKVIDGFSRTEYTIKRGRVVARRGECVVHGSNATIWVRPKVSENYDMGKDPDFVEKFDRYYTVRMSNYPVQESYLSRSRCIETETEL